MFPGTRSSSSSSSSSAPSAFSSPGSIPSAYSRASNSSSSASNSSSSSVPNYEDELWRWAQQTQQERAFQKVMKWVKAGQPQHTLDLSGLGLTSLPPLPANVQKLDASNNRIAALPEDFPASLVELELQNNQLIEVPIGLDYKNLVLLNLENNLIENLPLQTQTLNAACKVRLGLSPLNAEHIEALFDTDRHGVSRLKRVFVDEHRLATASLDQAFPRRFRHGEGEWLLVLAIESNRPDKVAQLLLHEEIDLNLPARQRGETPLALATLFGYKAIVRLLCLDPRSNPNLPLKDGSPPLRVAVITKPLVMGCVEALLSHRDIDPNLPSADGISVLHSAAHTGNTELAARLLDHPKTDPNAKGCKPHGDLLSPLSCAILKSPEVAAMLIAHPAIDVNADNQIRNGKRTAPVLAAVGCQHMHLVMPMIEKGARVDRDADRAIQRRIAMMVGQTYLETLVGPDEMLHSAGGVDDSPLQAERALPASQAGIYNKLKKNAHVLLKRLYELPAAELAFQLAAIAYHSAQSSNSSSLYSASGSDSRLQDVRILNNAITMRALPREQWRPIAQAACEWLVLLNSAGKDRSTAPEERMLQAPRASLPQLTQDILAAWGM